jgi:uncharacterized membrane protein YobD (UPF0266 family)
MIEPDPLLGQPLANYPSNRTRPLVLGVVICAAAAIFLNFTLATVTEWWGPTLTMLIMALLVLAIGWYVLHIWNREVILYEHGFSYREGSNTVYFVYSEVKSIRQRAQRVKYLGGLWQRRVYRTTIRTIRDEVLHLTALYNRIDELGFRLEECFNAIRRPVIEEQLKRGESVSFGDSLKMSAQGLVVGDKTLVWEDFAGYRAQKGHLVLLAKPDSEWHKIPLDSIDNLTLLLEMMRVKTQVS